MSRWHADFETRSAAPIKDCGAFRYACDPSTEILLLALAKDGDPPLIWDTFASDEDNAPALSLIREMVADTGTITAHNVKFELAVITYLWVATFGLDEPDVSRYRCTQALCNMAAIPSSLADASAFLGLTEKDPRGTALIKLFSVPGKTGWTTPASEGKFTIAGVKMTAPEAWALFREYCLKDVIVEREIERQLHTLELKGAVLDAFQLDLTMCLRGVPVNLKAVDHAEQMMASYTGGAVEEFRALTGLNPTQGVKVLAWLKERGYPGDNLQVATVSYILDGVELDEEGEEVGKVVKAELQPDVEKALRLRAVLSFAAIKKINKMRVVACPDGRIRGMINFWGAKRTGRSNSNFVQLQNMKRSTWWSGDLYRLICVEPQDMECLDILWGSGLECLATCVRHFVELSGGQKMMSADFSQVESRVLAWLSGHETKLKAFRENLDLYKIAANLMWGIPYEDISKDSDERMLGKICELALGFEGGPGALLRMAYNYSVVLSEEKAAEVVKLWRQGNEPIKDLWKLANVSALEAIRHPGRFIRINDKLRIGVVNDLGFPCLVMELPSGRRLCYPKPAINKIYKAKNQKTKKWEPIAEWKAFDAAGNKRDGVWEIDQITFYGQPDGKAAWGRVATSGGKIIQNATQAIAGDLMWFGGVNAEKAGIRCLFPVHDEQLTEYHPENGDSTEKLEQCMEILPAWALGLPIKAVGGVHDFYTKD